MIGFPLPEAGRGIEHKNAAARLIRGGPRRFTQLPLDYEHPHPPVPQLPFISSALSAAFWAVSSAR